MKLTVDLSGPDNEQLHTIANRLNVPAEVLAAAALHDLLAQQESDFQAAAARVLTKNSELYRRLA